MIPIMHLFIFEVLVSTLHVSGYFGISWHCVFSGRRRSRRQRDAYGDFVNLEDLCDIPAQDLIGLIGYSYQQIATFFPEADLQRTPRLNVPDVSGPGLGEAECYNLAARSSKILIGVGFAYVCS